MVLCSCTVTSREIYYPPETIKSDSSSAVTSENKNIHTITPYKQQMYNNDYHSDSEYIRKYHLANIHHVTSYMFYDFNDNNRFTARLIIKKSPADWTEKPKAPRTNFQFSLSDRWQLGADLPDINRFSNGSYIPIPRLTYDYGAIKLSTLYMPEIQSYNLYAVMGLYLIITF